MKVAGLTWWRNNYGSILQAYALQKKLSSFENIDYEILCQYGKKTTSLSNFTDKLKRFGIIKTTKKIFWKYGLTKLRRRTKNIQKFVDDNLKISKMEYNEQNIKESNKIYDAFICGSDQIWNVELNDLDSIYWLNFVENGKKKIAYAPSVGVNKYTLEQKKKVIENLKSFNYISTREESGTQLINETIGCDKAITVLDPTLLVERKIWDDISLKSSMFDFDYIFVYMLRGTKSQRKCIEKIAKEKNLKIVTMPFLEDNHISFYDFKFGDKKIWDGTPVDFINCIRHAKYVFTDSFHCMLFSTMYHKDFYTFPKIGKAQLSRIFSFQKMIEVNNRMINDKVNSAALDKIEKINWDRVDKILIEKRKESNNFLKNAFKEGDKNGNNN